MSQGATAGFPASINDLIVCCIYDTYLHRAVRPQYYYEQCQIKYATFTVCRRLFNILTNNMPKSKDQMYESFGGFLLPIPMYIRN